MMKIAMIRQRYTPFGGAERIMAQTIDLLAARGASVHVITRRWPPNARGAQPLVVDPFYLGRTWRDASFVRALARVLARESFDLVQANEKVPGVDVYRADDGVHREWLAQRARVLGPLRRAVLAASPYQRAVLARERALLEHPRLRKVICVSAMVRDEFRRHYGVAEHKLAVVRNGVDVAHFRPRAGQSPLRSALGIAASDPAFAFVGSGFERKGLAVAIRALARVPERAHLIVAGKDRHTARYRRLAQRQCPGRVHFAGALQDAREAYAAADAFVLPSLYDPFGTVVLEAMASALPVVCSTKCGASELVSEGANGYVCDALDVATLAERMRALCDRRLSSPMGEAARASAESATIERMTAALVTLYDELIDTSGAMATARRSPARAW